MSRYTVSDFAKAGRLMVVGALRPDDLREFQELGLMAAYFNFPSSVTTLALCDTLTPFRPNKAILAGLLYAESADDLEESGPGKYEPIGAVEFNFETGDIRTYVLRDEPLLKATIDGKRRSWREKHAQRR
jgi:hypothetical protein